MKKSFFLLAALMMTAFANAQTSIEMGKLFTFENGENGKPKPIDLNDPSTVKGGVVFIGDTRPAEKIQEGKCRGMRVTKSRRHFTVDGKVCQYQAALAFRRAPQGASVDHQIDVNRVPRSCMVQLKPTAGGKLTFAAQTNKPDGNNLYVAVLNGTTFTPLATLNFVKSEKTGKKDNPFETQSCDYNYTAGDELWIYSDGGINLYAISFSGTIDDSFTGTEPVATAKKVSKAQKNK